jgi:hypothetical protein
MVPLCAISWNYVNGFENFIIKRSLLICCRQTMADIRQRSVGQTPGEQSSFQGSAYRSNTTRGYSHHASDQSG